MTTTATSLPSGSSLEAVSAADDLLDLQNADNGTWWKVTQDRYGKDDQRGTLNEITPRKTARALRLLEGAKKVVTHNLGALLVNGTPGYRTFPPRKFEQRLIALGYTPGEASTWFSTTTTGNAGEDEWRMADRACLTILRSTTGTSPPNPVSTSERRSSWATTAPR